MDPQTYRLIGAAMKVHQTLGPGFLERAYEEAYSIELARQGIPHVTQSPVPIHYDGIRLQTAYGADVVAWQEVLVELKAMRQMGDIEFAQVLHYLKATGLQRGLLLNFGAASLQWKRFVLS